MSETNQFWPKITVLAVLSGLIYNSWIVGYWLNPVIARTGLASELEAIHQPFNWLFTTSDVVSSALILIVGWLLWQHLAHRRLLALALINVVIFGIGTIADTLLPMQCEPSLQRCPSFRVDHLLLIHGIFSILAAFCLFVSLAILWLHDHRSLLLNGLIVGYILFSLFSLIELVTPASGNWSQHYYLALCGVWLALFPAAIRKELGKST